MVGQNLTTKKHSIGLFIFCIRKLNGIWCGVFGKKILIDIFLVQQLIADQFPQWADLPITSVKSQGWDNRTFRLGEKMLVRLPSTEKYVSQVKKEAYWLPKLAPHLPLQIPVPLALGQPAEGYPWFWSIYQWIDGEAASYENIVNLNDFAIVLAEFLVALEKIKTKRGPLAGSQNFYRGGSLKIYDEQIQEAITILKEKIDTNLALAIWNEALASHWKKSPVWVHGDIVADNLLVKNGKLIAVIDFGCLGIGDPACDLVIAWTLFKNESREQFKKNMNFDQDTWLRARGWALWKALITCADLPGTDSKKIKKYTKILDEIFFEF